MSEYQYYEFLAIDRPLSQLERAELRTLSTRAEITATRLANEYHWGDFKGDPQKLMERYFDAHLYFANWGTRRLMFRVPRGALGTEIVQQYVHTDVASLIETSEHLIFSLYANREPDDYWEERADLGSMVDARSGLFAGDLRLLYLFWLFAVQCDEIADEETEPPVPAGLEELSESLQAVVDFLEIDEDLIAIAADASPDLEDNNPDEVAEWIATLPSREKDTLLGRVAWGEGAVVQALLRRRFRESAAGPHVVAGAPGRTAGELMVATDAYKAEIAKAAAERLRAEAARQEAEKAARYAQRLDDLSAREAAAWQRATALIDARTPRDYDAAVTLLRDLRALAERDGRLATFNERFGDLRRQHQRKPTLMERFDAAGLAG